MKKQITRILINTIALLLVAQFLPIVAATFLHFLGAGIILGLITLLIRPVLIILTLPLNFITLGLFTLIVNTWMVMLTSALMPGFYIPGFGVSFITAVIISLVNWVSKVFFDKPTVAD